MGAAEVVVDVDVVVLEVVPEVVEWLVDAAVKDEAEPDAEVPEPTLVVMVPFSM